MIITFRRATRSKLKSESKANFREAFHVDVGVDVSDNVPQRLLLLIAEKQILAHSCLGPVTLREKRRMVWRSEGVRRGRGTRRVAATSRLCALPHGFSLDYAQTKKYQKRL